MEFKHEGPSELRLGLVLARNVNANNPSNELEELISARLTSLEGGLSAIQDEYRTHVRDVFRNGSYKPTGRAKPASEYLLRAASESRFPRINTLVDCCNYLSMASLLPISIFDLDKANSSVFTFRLGYEGEEYVFNHAGQSISLKDLIVGCVFRSDGSTSPVVNAVKDSMITKTDSDTSHVAAAIYAPLADGPDLSLKEVCHDFARLLASTDPEASVDHSIIFSGETTSF